MIEIREVVDETEGAVPDNLWPIATFMYKELFSWDQHQHNSEFEIFSGMNSWSDPLKQTYQYLIFSYKLDMMYQTIEISYLDPLPAEDPLL
eukprot:gene3528-3866_t